MFGSRVQNENALRHSKNMKMGPPLAPLVRPKARALNSLDSNLLQNRGPDHGKLKTITKTDFDKKAALQRQRENCNKLSLGKSVVVPSVTKADKENIANVAKVQRTKSFGNITKKGLSLKRVESVSSIYNEPPKDDVKKEEDISSFLAELKFDSNIINIDANDEKDEYLLGGYVKQIYNYLRYLERSQNIRENYLTPNHIMTTTMRKLLVDWLFEVQLSFRLLNETIQLAIAIFDRYMQDHPFVPKVELQLVGVTSVFLASKYEEIFPPDLSDLVEITAKTYQANQILKMERNIFSALKYEMGRPAPSHFLRRYARIENVDAVTYSFAKYFVDLSLVHYSLCHVYPSLLAASAYYLALMVNSEKKNDTDLWTPALIYFSQYTFKSLRPVVNEMAKIIVAAPNSKYQIVRKKYADVKKHYGVSIRPELMSIKLHQLANSGQEEQTRL